MKLKSLYQEIVKKGIDADIRGKNEIEKLLKNRKSDYEKLTGREKEFFDTENLTNPYADTRLLNGDPETQVRSILVGVDLEGAELLLIDRLKEKGVNIDLAVAHHPEGLAYANFYDVMDLQADAFAAHGVSISVCENLLSERKAEVGRRVHAANHQRSVDIAKLLGINFMCMHTPCDNLAYQLLRKLLDKEKPGTLGKVMDLLYTIPEYRDAAKNNNAPLLAIGSKNSRVAKIHLEFTGGTEGPQKIYDKLSAQGVDTVIAMHQSEEHYKKCRDVNINVIFASHIASDALGINQMIDHLEKIEKIKVYECSGFRRFSRVSKSNIKNQTSK